MTKSAIEEKQEVSDSPAKARVEVVKHTFLTNRFLSNRDFII